MDNVALEVARELAHRFNPGLSGVSSVLTLLKEFLDERGLLETLIREPLAEDDRVDTVGLEIECAAQQIGLLHQLINKTVILLAKELPPDEFEKEWLEIIKI